MTLRQTIQAAPAKTSELIEKLSGTSNQALKTRESLFEQLKEQLTLYLDIEDQRLVPLLRKHAETKSLASDAAKGNKELRARLTELETVPQDSDDFGAKVRELQALLQQHVRDERKELLPAVLKALDEDEAANLAEAIDGDFAEAEKGKREEKRAAAAAAKKEAELAAEAEAAERAVVRAAKAAEREARAAAEKVTQAATAPIVQAVERTREAAERTQGALASFSGTFEQASADIRAVSASTSIAAQGASQFLSAWFEGINKASRAQAETSRRLLGCTSISQLVEVQKEIVSNATRNLIETNATFLEIAQKTSRNALSSLEAQRSR